MAATPFGIVPVGQSPIARPTSVPNPTLFLYVLPAMRSFSHVMVFLLPDVVLPENTAAAIYLCRTQDVDNAAQAGGMPNFKFLGGIGPGKESALYKLGQQSTHLGDENLVLALSVEPADSVSQRIQQLSAEKASSAGGNADEVRPPTTILAQRIIQNAFNFLASFTGSAGPEGVEVVPLKAFEDWWRKFESRIRADPSFLEKHMD